MSSSTLPGLRARLVTRGKTRDYGFVGREPDAPWWTAAQGATSFEQPSLVAWAGASRLRLFASGVPTSRRDRVGTRIRVSVELELEPDANSDRAAAEAIEAIEAFVAAWLELAAAADEGRDPLESRLARALDAALPEADVEAALGDVGGDRALALEAAALEAIASLAREPVDAPSDELTAPAAPTPNGWLARPSRDSRASFAARARALAAGETTGVLAYLNLAGDEAAAIKAALELGGGATAALLVPAMESAPTSGLAPLKKKNLFVGVEHAGAARDRGDGGDRGGVGRRDDAPFAALVDRARKDPTGFAFDALRAGVAAGLRASLRAAASASETLESLEEAREKLFGDRERSEPEPEREGRDEERDE